MACKNYIKITVIIMHKLPKDRTGNVAWINTMIKGIKLLLQECFHTFVATSLLGWLINPSPVFNNLNPSPVK